MQIKPIKQFRNYIMNFNALIKHNGSVHHHDQTLALITPPILSDEHNTCYSIVVSEAQYDDGEFDELFSDFYVAEWNIIDINAEPDEMCNWDSPLSVTHSACL